MTRNVLWVTCMTLVVWMRDSELLSRVYTYIYKCRFKCSHASLTQKENAVFTIIQTYVLFSLYIQMHIYLTKLYSNDTRLFTQFIWRLTQHNLKYSFLLALLVFFFIMKLIMALTFRHSNWYTFFKFIYKLYNIYFA